MVPRSCRSGTQGDISGPEGGEAAPSRPAAANKGRRFPPETLTEVEVSALIRAASGRAPTGIRNRALIVVLYRGGLRMFEALALGVRDVDVEAGTIRVRPASAARRGVRRRPRDQMLAATQAVDELARPREDTEAEQLLTR